MTDSPSSQEAKVRAAMRRAFSLGETHWRLSDSESPSQWRKADETYDKFAAMVDETVAASTAREAEVKRLRDALAAVVACDEQNRLIDRHHYAKGSPMWKAWQAAREALKDHSNA